MINSLKNKRHHSMSCSLYYEQMVTGPEEVTVTRGHPHPKEPHSHFRNTFPQVNSEIADFLAISLFTLLLDELADFLASSSLSGR